MAQRLKFSSDISHRCHLAWESLPVHLRYTPHCWGDKYPVAVCLLLTVSYLAYLYNDFLIQRLLAGKKNPRGSTALLSVSSEILSSVLTIGAQREQMVDIRPDFTWTVGSPFTITPSFSRMLNYSSLLIDSSLRISKCQPPYKSPPAPKADR